LDDLIIDFIAETREGLEALDSDLVRFERRPDDPELLGGIFRLIHTIKGTCGFLGLTRLQTVAHAAESVLGAFRDGELAVTPTAVTAILDTVDLIRALIEALGVDGAEPAGDDSDLIGRLEAVLQPQAGIVVPPGDAPAVENRAPLIEQLGGDATIDAACEMALAQVQAGAFDTVDPDRLQAALCEALIGAARGTREAASLAAVLPAAFDGDLLVGFLDRLAAALGDLDVPPAPIERLLSLVRPGLEAAGAAAEARPDRQEAIAPPAAAADVAAPSTPRSAVGEGDGPQAVQSIRVSVDALEHLMTVVSELVLIRNQLIQTLRLDPESPFAAPLNRLNQVTSELQEGVMTTRMQPISGAWAKLPRLVRDLAQDLGKQIDLAMTGQETELDRQVLELIKDPLTHMIRNAADHGLETPDERRAAGKPATGRITLGARHEGGAIVIEVADDGRGLSAAKIRAKALSNGLATPAQIEAMCHADVLKFIFAPGFSTAGAVTAVSGRGVGMDVVRTNIEKIGGTIELTSSEGEGARFTIRIPLTLTIVSALIVECCGERFAMPQSSVIELVSASDASGRTIEYVDGAAVLRLRDRLLPLVSLQTLLGLEPVESAARETCIVVAQTGSFTFGVIVDRVFDTEEIVVKPVATVLRHLRLYSGATILGDGSVILILDFKGISVEAGAGQVTQAVLQAEQDAASAPEGERSAILVFRAANDALKATPLADVARIEEITASQLERVDGATVIQYRGKLMPVVGSEAGRPVGWDDDSARPLLVFARDDRAIGLLVNEIVDIVESSLVADLRPGSPGCLGSLIIGGAATELIDLAYYWEAAQSGAAPAVVNVAAAPPAIAAKRLLVIDRSPFCQVLLQPVLRQAGYEVTVAPGPEAALELHDRGERFDLILADTTQRGEAARALAEALTKASAWHATPLLGLGLHGLGGVSAELSAAGAAPVETRDAA
jgi:two-component system chemotaxis sensor kinase CheA